MTLITMAPSVYPDPLRSCSMIQVSLTSYFGEVVLQYMTIIAVIIIPLISLLCHNPHIIDSV